MIIQPSKRSEKRISQKLSNVIQKNRAISANDLINKLNPIIIGWGNYHQSVCAKETFKRLDHKIYEMLRKWTKRKHNNKGKEWIIEKYWQNIKGRKWQFATKEKMIRRFSDIPIVRYTSIAKNKNPYLEPEYYENKRRIQKEKRLKAYKGAAAYKLMTDNNL